MYVNACMGRVCVWMGVAVDVSLAVIVDRVGVGEGVVLV